MNHFIKKTLCFFILGVCIFFSVFYLRLHIGELYPELKLLRNSLKEKCDIVFLGSSVNKYAAKSDTDKRAISEMINDRIQNKKVIGISHDAYQLDIYEDIIKYIVRNKNKEPITIIVPINLRSFAPTWNLRPTYQFVKEKYYLIGLPYIINFKNYREISDQEFYMQAIFFNNQQIGTLGEFENKEFQADSLTDLKMGFISNYMQPINEGNEKLIALEEIDKISKHKSDLKIVFYITPIDFRRAESLNIKNFQPEVLKNIEIIKSKIKYSELIDLSFHFNSNLFDYERRPNEHLNMYGRSELAKILSESIQE
jgi:hypothetical protein